MLAELLIFVPSATRFQYDWFERQWNHFVMQFDAIRRLSSDDKSQNQSDPHMGTPTQSKIANNYHIIPDKTARSFHTPDFICWKDEAGIDHRLGEMDDNSQLFDLAKNPLFHFGLASAILVGLGPEEVIVYDSRADNDFRATWRTDLIRSQLQNYAIRIAGLTLVIAAIIIAPLYWLLSTQFVRPLGAIAARMRRFSDNPTELTEPVDITGASDEIKTMSEELESLTDQVRRALRQKERLADIGEATAKINHDLRNILVSATLVTDTLKDSEDPNIQRIAPHIERAISDATMMTQNMMNYLTETKSEPIMSFDLAEMADNLSHDTKLTITTAGARMLIGMPNLFYRMLLNLARNAKRAGAENLVIDVWRAGHLAVIDISDDGPGIGADLKNHLFNAFYSGHKRDTGLGLAIAKDLSVAMGGELRLSRSSAHGSEFRLSVPKSWLAEG